MRSPVSGSDKCSRSNAVAEHRRAGLAGVQLPGVDFGDVRDEVGLDAARVAEDLGQAREERVVAE
jgi:hypothetical protein